MATTKKLNILLSYVSYPVTTAVYLERALRENHNVTTIGATFPQKGIKTWNLENMKLPIKTLDIETNFTPDMGKYINEFLQNNQADLFLWVESVPNFSPKNIDKIKIPTACYLIDSHLKLKEHIEWAKNFDYVFIAQREYVDDFKNSGIKSVNWLPLGCDTQIHNKFSDEKQYDIGFVGSFFANPRREELLEQIRNNFNLYYQRCFWTEMAEIFSKSKIAFNNAVRNDLNMRVFEVLSTGSLLLTDNPLNSGQDELFTNGEDIVVYDDNTMLQTIQFYLENDELREAIALRGREIVHNAHKYKDRTDDLLEVAIGNKATTLTAKQIREKSLQNLSVSKKDIGKLTRSFVIPVIDFSPASEFNINTLLKDLENIEGNVIVIFNSQEIAEKLKNHPRIDYYAIMSCNVGVAPAWNIGLNISRTPITYILNSDLHLEKQTVKQLDEALINLPYAAIVGPQGSFVNFQEQKDYTYLDKGTFNQPIVVDAVSGFLFAVKTKYFTDGTLNFENRYAPCYFEEWDLGFKIKLAGLKSYIVPTTKYTHHWSGSIRSMKTIKYFDKEETIEQIHKRNSKIFNEFWQRKAKELGRTDFLESGWFEFAVKISSDLILNGELDQAEKICISIVETDPDNYLTISNLGVIEAQKGNKENARKLFQEALRINPNYAPAKENMNLL